MTISFENTEIAFKVKTNRELQKAYLLFKTIERPWLVKLLSGVVNFLLRIRFPLAWILKPTIYSHFCGGTSIEDCTPTVKKLAGFGVRSVLDYSVEGTESEDAINAALEETLRSIRHAGAHPDIPYAVFKPTAFSSNHILEMASSEPIADPSISSETEKFRERIDLLCRTAYEADIPVMIDAEDYCYQEFIDRVVTEMMEKYNREKAIVFNTYQLYRWDRLDFFKSSYEKAVEGGYFLGAKFVRGAYMEKERARAEKMGYPSPIHIDKESTDEDYNQALRFAVENIDRISIFNGTHNEKSSLYLAQLMEEKGIARDDERIYFSQLYGMSDHISFNLAHEGYNVAKYLPYGPVRHVVPYLIRRAEENTSVAGQTSRELSLLAAERKRRKRKK